MPAFIEKYHGSPNRKHIFRQMDRSGIFDLPPLLHLLKSESLDNQKADELAENFDNYVSNSILMENGDEIRLENNPSGIIVKEN